MNVDGAYIREILKRAVRINSVNPGLVPGAPGEEEMARMTAAEMERLGIPSEITAVQPGRFNAVGTIKGTGGGPSLLFNAHLDTVGVEGMADPFSAEESEGRLYGRGALDTKGGIAAALGAAKALKDNRITLKGDLHLTFTADEEHESRGTESLLDRLRTDAAVVLEPTDLAVCTAHKGFALFEVESRGVAAHGGGYQGGVDANTHMARIAVALENRMKEPAKTKRHPLLGSPTLHVPLIKGGSQLFIYADDCRMSVERRTLPEETREDIVREMEDIIADLAEADPTFKADAALKLWRAGFASPEDSPIRRTLEESLEKITGRPPQRTGHHWWEDSALFSEAGIDTIIIGPGGEGLHQNREWVDMSSVETLASVLAHTAVSFCRLNGR